MSIRAFLGIELAPRLRDSLDSCAEAIRCESRAWRGEKWVPKENMHVTLRFMGMLADDDVERVMEVTARACEGIAEYPLMVGELQALPRPRAAAMLWATLAEGSGQTAALASAIEDAVIDLGHERNPRPFSAHITLARARKPLPMPFDALDAGNRVLYATGEREKKMSVRGVTLFSSTLTPHGPLYEEIARAPLSG